MSPQDNSREIKRLLSEADEASRRVRRHGKSAARHLRSAAATISSQKRSGRHASKNTTSASR